ncbi:MAG: M1 family metallopeptidase [Candidatus Marinimicrobia bacterium]|nr:M1 family metallopeptidase [Candidatus Neomarinimicrobiota bacterium]MBL7010383.1 M1 family metallopeptidase [Candidatus Neomarinimicrobiota bacterium]MBL7030856.1 M1 family metallopeptidase [Candidatus Neomarinimicrobiota bacterium]
MNKYFSGLLVIVFTGCIPMQPQKPLKPASTHQPTFLQLTERNRLLGALLPERSCYDVQHYDINIDIDVKKKYLKGYVDFTALAVNDFKRLQVDLASDMQLNGVWYLENKLEVTRKEDAIIIEFPEVKMGNVFKFRVKYEGSPQEAKNPPWDGGFVWGKDEMGRDYVSVSCEGDGCSLWWPMKDHISEEPDNGARMTFTVPQNLVCISNGKLLETKQDVFSGKQSYTWEVASPINNYSISVQLGNYVLLQDTLQRKDKVEVLNHFVLDYHKQVASTVFPQSKNIIRFMEKYFGDYQFWNDGYKLVEVSYLGMEHQSAVTYGNVWSNWGGDHRSWTKDYYGIIDGLLFHETAHEWWGNSITAADPAHMWLHEGTAVYSEAMFIEQELGYNVMIDFMLRKRKGIQNKIPIVGPENENYWAFGDSYNKGAWVLHTLRHIINDDRIWWDLLKSFAVNNAKSHVNTDDFIQHVENKTETDLGYFFQQYFYDHQLPTLEYFQKDDQLYYQWTNVADDFKMPIDLDVNGVQARIFPSTAIQSVEVPPFAVLHIRDWEFLINKKKNPDLAG